MAATIVRSLWTGTRGVLDAGLPEDWDEAFAIVSGTFRESEQEAIRADMPTQDAVELSIDS